MLNQLAISQSDCRRTSPYQLSYNNLNIQIFNPKQAGGGGGIRPQAGSSLCCAETLSSRKLKLSDFYYILIGLNSEYKPVP